MLPTTRIVPGVDVILRGTISLPPVDVVDSPSAYLEHGDEYDVTHVDSEHWFTYELRITDVKHLTTNPDGTTAVEYQKPGCDDHVTETVTLPAAFTVAELHPTTA